MTKTSSYLVLFNALSWAREINIIWQFLDARQRKILATSTAQCTTPRTHRVEEQPLLLIHSLHVLFVSMTRSQPEIQAAPGVSRGQAPTFGCSATSTQDLKGAGAHACARIPHTRLSRPKILFDFWDYSHIIFQCVSKLIIIKPQIPIFKTPEVTSEYI